MTTSRRGTHRLLSSIQRHLAAIYSVETDADAAEYLLEVEEQALLAAREDFRDREGQLLLLEEEDDLWLGLHLSESVRDQIEETDPYERLDACNLWAFLTAVEETSHFLYVVWNASHGRPVTKFDLELQGEVDKFASSVLLLRGQAYAGDGARQLDDLSLRLFNDWVLDSDLDEEEESRYRTANHLAARYCRTLEARYLPPHGLPRIDSLLQDLRYFYRRRGDAKIRHTRQSL